MNTLNKDIKLTEVQKQAVDLALNHFRVGKNTIIAGYAGTGKSTLVRFFIQELLNKKLIAENEITFTAFTGKACQILTNKGCPAVTLHKLLYDVIAWPNGSVSFELKYELDYKLVIVDECSMVPMNMYQELISFGVPLVFLGDPGQLPPIQEGADNHLLSYPDIFLTEVLRQAQDSPIIRLSMKIRNHESIDDFNFPEARVIHKNQLKIEDLKTADMILVGTNDMRKKVNKAMRKLLGKKGLIDENEKLICTLNYWENEIEDSLTNGTVGLLREVKDSEKNYSLKSKNYDERLKKFVIKKDVVSVSTFAGCFTSEAGLEKYINIDRKFLTDEVSTLSIEQKAKIKPRKAQPLEFTYAYAITGHKAQGSEWNKVVIFEESFPFGEDHTKWLYTCVTRACKEVILVRP